MERMESLNPYQPAPFNSVIHDDRFDARSYLPRHFCIFHFSYLVGMTVQGCVAIGPTKTLLSFVDNPQGCLVLLTLGCAVWLVHALYALLNRDGSGPLQNATVGALGFAACVIAEQLLEKFGPDLISIPLSWTPEYILITAHTVGSIIAVSVFARIGNGSRKKGQPGSRKVCFGSRKKGHLRPSFGC